MRQVYQHSKSFLSIKILFVIKIITTTHFGKALLYGGLKN